MAFRLTPEIKHYDWGSSGDITEFLGLAPTALPEAEAWFGRHPLCETSVRDSGIETPFNDWLDSRNSDFDILVKILSAARPLSIQVHPPQEKAREGFGKEEKSTIARDSPLRVFRDARPKPELIVALSPDFRALIGFVDPNLFQKRLTALVSVGGLPSVPGGLHSDSSYPGFFAEWVLQSGDEAAEASRVLSEWIANGPDWSTLADLGIDPVSLEQIDRAHPGDLGILLALAMHHVRLGLHDALFVAPGVVHAYVKGFGLEIMLPSDNVVRAGLTTKARHPEIFLDVANLVASQTPAMIVPGQGDDVYVYSDDSMPFELTRVSGAGSDFPLGQDSLIVVEAGRVRVGHADSLGTVGPGEVVFAEAAEVICRDDSSSRMWIAAAPNRGKS